MPTKYNPSDFENELKYVEAELGFELDEEDYKLNDEGKLVELEIIVENMNVIKFEA